MAKKKLKRDWWKLHRAVLFLIGTFLFLDGVFSLYFGNACLYNCYNNSPVGNIVRWMRSILGVYLMYVGIKNPRGILS